MDFPGEWVLRKDTIIGCMPEFAGVTIHLRLKLEVVQVKATSSPTQASFPEMLVEREVSPGYKLEGSEPARVV